MSSLQPWPWETPEPGIYFNMPFEEYCGIKAINAGFLKNMIVSPTDGWANSYMNPLNDEMDDDTKAKMDGRAYHKMILEGKDAFYAEYAPEYVDDGSEDVVRTVEDIKAKLREIGQPVTFPKKEDGIARLITFAPLTRILDLEKKDYEEAHAGKELLKRRTINHIELTNHMIQFHPDLKAFFAGGYPEVTVIWDDPYYKMRFKIRIDYLKIAPVCDLKTFANTHKEPIEVAIETAMRNQKMHIQSFLYMRGRDFARTAVLEGRVFGGENVNPQWLEQFAQTKTEEFWYVFVQKGIAPVVRGGIVSMLDEDFVRKAGDALENASKAVHSYYKAFGQDAWVDLSPPIRISYSSMRLGAGYV